MLGFKRLVTIRGSSEGRGNVPAASASTHMAASPTQIGSIPAVGGANALFHSRPQGGDHHNNLSLQERNVRVFYFP